MAKLPFSRNYINRYYNSQTLSKFEEHKGPMLFVTHQSGQDQMLDHNKKNMTLEIAERHKGTNQILQLDDVDHLTPWSPEVHNKVKKFLQKQEIICNDYRKLTFDDF